MRVWILWSIILFLYSLIFSHVFAVFDRDHDGTIDFHEFLLAVAAGTPGDLDSHLKYVFQMCDVSGDGEMDLEELTTFLKASVSEILWWIIYFISFSFEVNNCG